MSDIEKILPDGVYLGLDEATYFAQPRDGSTDLCRLFREKEGYWWKSGMNPDYVDEPADAKGRTFGKALHALILEGDEAYAERFATIPSKAEMRAKHGDLFCITVGDMETALEKRGMHPKRMKKEELIPYVRSRAPDLVIWDDVEVAWAKANAGKLALTGEEHRQLQVMVEAVREHPDVGPLFKYGADNVPMIEVSVLWTERHGIHEMKRRARFDAMPPQQTLDLKAMSNIGSRPLAFAIGDHLAKYAYHVQMADHHVARKVAMRLVQEGRVFGGTPEQRKWLARYPTDAQKAPEYGWIFYQRPDSKNGLAPVVVPWIEDYGSELHMDGIRARREAIATYLRCMAQFGADKPWTRIEPAHTTAEGAPHRVFLPAYIAMPPVPGEDEDL